MATEEQRAFLRDHRLVIVGLSRKAGPPHMSPVYYAMDGDDIVVSTTVSRLKTKLVMRLGEASLCVLGEEAPFPYLLVYGRARIEEEGAVDAMAKIAERMSGKPLPDSAMPLLEEKARAEGRVVLRVIPYEYHSTMPLASGPKHP